MPKRKIIVNKYRSGIKKKKKKKMNINNVF